MDLLDQQRGAPDFQPVVKRIQGLQAAAINVFQSSGWGNSWFSTDGVMAIDCGFPDGCRITNALILKEKDKGVCTSCFKYLGMEHATDGLQVGARFKPVGKSKQVWDGVMFNPDKERGPRGFYQTRVKKIPEGVSFITYMGYVPVSRYTWYTCQDEHVLYRSLCDEKVFPRYPKW